MGKLDFDNLLKVIKVQNTLNSSTIVSTEVDFELPRGFIAKIWKIIMDWNDWHEDVDGQTSTTDMGVHMLLLRDPDDTTTTEIPSNQVQHDAIAELQVSFFSDVDAGSDLIGPVISETARIIEIPEHVDLITARNMRFNIVGVGSDVALLTESQAQTHIYYTLEKVTDADILELLDIL